MLKKLCTIVSILAVAVPTMAQDCCKKGEAVQFAPKKGQWQVNLSLGNGNAYSDNMQFLLPQYSYNQGEIGLPNGSTANSGNLAGTYLNIAGLDGANLVNIAGIEAKYFMSDCWALKAGFSMNINLTPKKDYVEGDYESVADMIIPAQKYINAQMTNNWYAHVGFDRYFKVANPRIHPYVGATVGFQMARIEINEPYTGEVYADGTDADYEDVPTQVYVASGKAGQMFGLRGAATAGIEYSLAPGLVLGFEFNPLSYRYDVIQICPKGFDTYNASHHNIKIFEMPSVKLGIRF